MKIKVCGLRIPENIKAVAGLTPDYLGFIFYGPSPRFVDDLALESFSQLPSYIKKTAVFVNETKEKVSQLIDQYHFEAIQLHGGESAEFCTYFKGKVQVLKAFGINEDFDFNLLDKYKNNVDFFLFDTKTPVHGGSGKTFDWGILNNYKLDIPFFLSGGLSLENLEEIKNISHPQFYGVDLNSKFEIEPGMKDLSKLEKAFDIIKQKPINELRS
ncbi:phosphoribosylanthranilate isomerase [Mucilaginibacter sp.]|uniref:phosphoribosylanthranilate isomerase n=1 Tax=Mucilaginibacter sp. TaxID=1882438 RepID=UPI002846EC7A|nr:phosphoribosylanthranilate isomerase [Mucilaginibacter sp.]MDR3693807.1 phosphoribosylanthranilate isomerase [Mucilaginibacter sp.]